jgi:outer membrane lipoprotein SlyB
MMNMKKIKSSAPKAIATHLMGALLLYGSMVSAAEIKGRVADNTSGRMVAGWAGFLVGGAAGGPAGAIAGGLISAWGGAKVQQASGQSGTAYEVELDDGSREVVRSPNLTWQVGDQVEVVGNRLTSLEKLADQ